MNLPKAVLILWFGLAPWLLSAQPDGKKIFEENCTTCHIIGKKMVGPDLQGVGERRSDEWMKSFIKNSTAMIENGDSAAVAVFKENGEAAMTAFADVLSEEEIQAVIDYIKVAEPAPEPPKEEEKVVKKKPVIKDKPMDPKVMMVIAALVIPVILMIYLLIIVSWNLTKYLSEEKRAQGEDANMASWITGEMTDEVIEGHSYDGIKELNNSMPPWLMWIFYGTALFAAIYLYIFMFAKTGDSQLEEYEKEMAEAVEKYGDLDVVRIAIEPVTDPGALTAAEDIFVKNCAACHRKDGGGNSVGPNLTDEYWLNGGKLEDIFNTIREGRPSKGMISWKGKFTDKEILNLASYIKTLQGSNPPDAKAPQGEKFVE